MTTSTYIDYAKFAWARDIMATEGPKLVDPADLLVKMPQNSPEPSGNRAERRRKAAQARKARP